MREERKSESAEVRKVIVRKRGSAEVRKRISTEVGSLCSLLQRKSYQIAILIFSILLIFVHQTLAEDTNSIFKKGNQFYEKGLYDEAIKEYSILLDQGYESGNLYFNIGNSYFKKGELGMAILNYERAKRSIPDDSDLRSNLNFAMSKIVNTSSQPDSRVIEKIMGIFGKLTLNGLTILVSIVYAGIILILTSSMFIQAIRKYRTIVIIVLLLVLIPGAFSLYGRVSLLGSEAIVMSSNAEAKFEPLDDATTYFTLYEGMKIYILEAKDHWLKIKRPDGKSGWIKKDSAERI